MYWLASEERYLRKHAQDGVEACAVALRRSPAAVARFAHRHGISLRRLPPTANCIRCGVSSTRIDRVSELCPRCKAQEQLLRAQQAHQAAAKALERSEQAIGGKAMELDRKKAALRTATNRLRESNGTRPRADRDLRK